ncbi:hypothetical protein [Microbacterium sp. bgisy189]|uniref:hypothetical protein n=1 Tax=Microbacterium sp. bgisy189 TaxID=3413798 RepID=UPI003EB7410E
MDEKSDRVTAEAEKLGGAKDAGATDARAMRLRATITDAQAAFSGVDLGAAAEDLFDPATGLPRSASE